MPALSNIRNERFAQELSNGTDYKLAYTKAGYKESASNASTLSKRPDIVERIAELMLDASKAAGITPDAVLNELNRIAFANMGDFASWDNDGVELKPSDMLTRDQLAAVREVEITTRRGEKTVKVRLKDGMRALELLGKATGALKEPDAPPQEHLHLHVHSPLEQIASRIAVLSERGRSRLDPVSADTGAIGGPALGLEILGASRTIDAEPLRIEQPNKDRPGDSKAA